MCYNNRMNMIKKTVIFSLLSVCSIFCPPAQAAVGIRGSDIAQHTITVNNLAFTPIISTDTLQAGTTFYVSSGTVGSGGLTVLGPLSVQGSSVSSGTILAGNLQLTGWAVAGSSITAGAGFYGDGSKLSGVITSTSALQADINSRVLKAGDTMTGSLSVIPSAIGVMIQVSTIIPTIDTTHAYYGLYSVNGSANNNTPSGTARKATGIYGEGFGIASESGPSAVSVGVSGKATGYGTNYGLYGYASNGAPNYAAYLDGDMLSTGTVSAVSFIGDGSRLTGVVKTTGDTMTGPLTQTSSITLHSPTNGVAFSVIRLQDNSIIPADISIGADSSRNYKVSGGAGEGMKWAPNNSPSHAMYLDSSGNLAIGNGTSPSYPLDVDGIVRATSYIGNGSTLTGVITSTSVLSSQISANTAALTTAAYLASTQTFTAAQTMTGPLTLAGSTLTVTGNAFSVGATTLSVNAGMVGIGTSSPISLLNIRGGVSAGTSQAEVLRMGSKPDADRDWRFIIGKNADSQWGNYSMRVMPYDSASTGDLVMGAGTSGRIRFGVGTSTGVDSSASWTDRMIILPTSGNIGVGTLTPTYKFDVWDGTAAITVRNNIQSSLSFFNYVTAPGRFENGRIQVMNDPSYNDSGYMRFLTARTSSGGLTEKMVITPNGNIGIGNSNPQYLIHASTGLFYMDGTGNGITLANGSLISGAASPTTQTTYGDKFIAFGDKTGYMFSINGGQSSYNRGLTMRDNGFTRIGLATHIPSQATFEVQGDGSAKIVAISTGVNSDNIVVTANGNLGVGNSNPTSKILLSSGTFTVDGNTATSIQVNGNIAMLKPSAVDAYVSLGTNGSADTYIGESIVGGMLPTAELYDTVIKNTGSKSVVLGINTKEVVRVNSSGMTVKGNIIASSNTALTTYTETKSSAAVATTYDVSWSSGSVYWLSLNDNTTLTFSGAVDGQSLTLFVKQNVGSKAITWPTISWPSATAPTLTTTAGKTDIITLEYIGGVYYGFTGGLNY